LIRSKSSSLFASSSFLISSLIRAISYPLTYAGSALTDAYSTIIFSPSGTTTFTFLETSITGIELSTAATATTVVSTKAFYFAISISFAAFA
jgi:hypothetical protein